MKLKIIRKLNDIATHEPLHLLHVAESGSRAWGFPSPDSDYDVRAIYLRPQGYYLCIDEHKDSFEFIENQWFDIGGWDIRKALKLLRKSNAVLLEWLQSPIVYAQDHVFVAQLRELLPHYVQSAPLLHHYRGIANNALMNMNLQGKVRLKKWLYVLRPLLAARWVMLHGGVPPMQLKELMVDWQVPYHHAIGDLIALKAQQDEDYYHVLPRDLVQLTINLANEVAQYQVPTIKTVETAPLDALFRQTLQRIYPSC